MSMREVAPKRSASHPAVTPRSWSIIQAPQGGVGTSLEATIPRQSMERAVATFDRLPPDFERAVAVAEGTPAVVASERKAAIEGLGKELTRTIAFLQEERIAALQQVTAERIAAITEMSWVALTKTVNWIAPLMRTFDAPVKFVPTAT